MSLTNYHTNWDFGSYLEDLFDLLKTREDARLYTGIDSQINIEAKFDDNNSIAIGYGLDLLVNSNAEINGLLAEAGLPALSAADEALLSQARLDRQAGFVNESYATDLIDNLSLAR